MGVDRQLFPLTHRLTATIRVVKRWLTSLLDTRFGDE
jgi:hypothetical protein